MIAKVQKRKIEENHKAQVANVKLTRLLCITKPTKEKCLVLLNLPLSLQHISLKSIDCYWTSKGTQLQLYHVTEIAHCKWKRLSVRKNDRCAIKQSNKIYSFPSPAKFFWKVASQKASTVLSLIFNQEINYNYSLCKTCYILICLVRNKKVILLDFQK